ncbi:MAG: hypothetical protein JST39_16075 [Bacteroidetes bacterium]|nr:hypothetical protein [Bacteroidota bacterium]
MKKMVLFLSVLSLAGCTKKTADETAAVSQSPKAVEMMVSSCTPSPCCWIAATNQSNDQLEAYDPAVFDWSGTGGKKWSFIPTTARGYDASAEIPLWGDPADVKLRNTTVFSGYSQVIVTSGGRLATIAAYPSGQKIWTMGYSNTSPQVSIHACELLPNGNIALASAERNWIRVYASAPSAPSHSVFSEFSLISAHGALWDPSINRLWVLGDLNGAHVLTALQDTGTTANPGLKEDASRRDTIPGFWGHDLYPDYDDANKLWVTMNVNANGGTMGVASYNKTTKIFTWVPGAANRNFVKSIGNQPGANQLVETRPDSLKSPAPSPYAPYKPSWNTSTVEFYNKTTGALVATRPLSGASFYKARVWNPCYQ